MAFTTLRTFLRAPPSTVFFLCMRRQAWVHISFADFLRWWNMAAALLPNRIVSWPERDTKRRPVPG